MSGASEQANGRASGPVLTSLFLFVPDHSASTTSSKITRSSSRATPPIGTASPAAGAATAPRSRCTTPTSTAALHSSTATASPVSIFRGGDVAASRPSSRGVTPIVVRDCYVPLSRTGSASRRGSSEGVSSSPAASSLYRQHQRVHVASRSSSGPPPARVVALCLCSTRDPAFLGPVTRAAKRHLTLYENIQKRRVMPRVTRTRASDANSAHYDAGDGRAVS